MKIWRKEGEKERKGETKREKKRVEKNTTIGICIVRNANAHQFHDCRRVVKLESYIVDRES